MNKRTYSQILDSVVRDNMKENTDLAPRILRRIQKGKQATMQPRLKVLATIILLLLALAIVLINVPSVRAAIQHWFGYVPEIGLISDGQLRTLADPVSLTREGITLTIKEMWATSDRTLIQYSVEGWKRDPQGIKSPGKGCLKVASLRLPDQELKPTQPQSIFNFTSSYELKSIYPALPMTVNEVTFAMPCVLLALPGEAPENWELSLHLVPAPADAVFPVIEISTPVEAPPTVLPQTNTGSRTDGISLALDRAVKLDSGYLLYVTLHWENTGLDWIDIPDPATLHLQDASGQTVAYELDLDATNAVQANAAPGQNSFAIKAAALQGSGPLTLILDSVSVSMDSEASFTFDPGPDPQPGQVWELNRTLDVGHGHSLHVLRVTYNVTDGMQAWLSFDMDSETGVTYATLLDKAHPLTGTAGGGGGSFLPGPFTSDLYYLEPLPKGPITVNIIGFSVHLPGHWQTTWTP